MRKPGVNKKYISIGVSVRTNNRTARNSGGAARQESNPQELHIVPSVSGQAKTASTTMKMTTLRFRNWELIVDRETTQMAYDNASNGSAESCNCNDCKNFANYRESVYPEEIKQLFFDLGIDYKKESEVSHFARLDSGLHFYSGWFHFKGQFIGKDCTVPLKGDGYTTDLYKVSDSFSLGFRSGNALTFFNDKVNLVQIEFDAKIPWTIDKELESE